MKQFLKNCIIISLLFTAVFVFGQKNENIKDTIHFRSNISITNNGFSAIPTFTLGKPAGVATFSIAGKKFSFDPEIRYSLEGKPWSFVLIWRYKLIDYSKFKLIVGAHLPAIAFKNTIEINNGVEENVLVGQRFLPFEMIPTYVFNKKCNLGLYGIFAKGLQISGPQDTAFLSLNANFSHLSLGSNFELRFNPQLFYLRSDHNVGTYFASGLTISNLKNPFSVSTIINKAIKTELSGKDFNWNVSLHYTFSKKLLY